MDVRVTWSRLGQLGLIVSLAGVLTACTGSGSAPPAPSARTGTPTQSASDTATAAVQPRGKEIRFQGIGVIVPPGWHTAPYPYCGGPANDTVAIDDHSGRVSSCPMIRRKPPATYIAVSTLYGPRYALGWSGTRTLWHGQPAWIGTTTTADGTTVRLTLPWLNTQVIAQAKGRVAAHELLARVLVHPQGDLGVPVGITSASIYGFVGPTLRATVTGPTLTRLSGQLHGLKTITDPAAACGPINSTADFTVTLRTTRASFTYLVRSGDCNQVISGTGVAAALTLGLRQDLEGLTARHG